MTRDEIRDEIWDALMNRMDIDVSTTDLADAALERLESLGLIALAAAARQGGDVKQAPGEAPQSGHEVATPNPSHIPLMNKDER